MGLRHPYMTVWCVYFYVTWLTDHDQHDCRKCVTVWQCIPTWHDSLITINMTVASVWHDCLSGTWLSRLCIPMWHDSLITTNMTVSSVWHDCLSGTWLSHLCIPMWVTYLSYLCIRYATWVCVPYESFTRVPWLRTWHTHTRQSFHMASTQWFIWHTYSACGIHIWECVYAICIIVCHMCVWQMCLFKRRLNMSMPHK